MFYLIVFLFLFFHISSRGNTMITTLYAMHLHANSIQLGVIVALSSLFPMIFAVYAGQVSDRFGYRLPIILGTFGVSVALLLPFIFQDQLYILYISQALFGLGYIFVMVTTQNLVGALSNDETRSRNFGTNSLSFSLASLIGPSFTGFFIDYVDYNITYLFLSIFAVIPGVFFLFHLIPVPSVIVKEQVIDHRFINLLKSRPLRKTYITSGILLTGIGIYEFYFPIYGKHIGFSASTIGLILSINASAYFIVRLFMQALIRRFDEETVLNGCLLASGVAFIFIPFFDDYLVLAFFSFLLGLGLGCGQPLSIVMAYNRSPKGQTGEVLGIRLMVNKIVQFSVPMVFGSVGSVLGFFPVFWSNAFLFILSGFFGFEKREEKRQDHYG